MAGHTGQQRYWTEFRSIVEEAVSREQALEKVKTRIADMASRAEIVTLQAPALPIESNETEDKLLANGWDDHGIFKDNPAALQLFDEVEKERDQHLIGDA